MEIERSGLLPEALRVYCPEIDLQHEALFVRLEALKATCFGNSNLPISEFESFLEAIDQHFSSEEQLATQADVEFLQHSKVHRDNLLAMKDGLDVVLSGVSDAYSFLRYVEFWFERHIIQFDKPFAADLKSSIKA